MGGAQVDSSKAPFVTSPEEMAGKFHAELMMVLPALKKRLIDDPSQLEQIEREVHTHFDRGADLVTTGLIALVMAQAAWEEASERTRLDFQYPLTRGRERKRAVRLLGGLLIWLTTRYCAPRRTAGQKADDDACGVYVGLAQFGFGKGCSPGLESRVARQAALGPSLQFAQEELERSGVKMDVKTVRRITQQCGEGLLGLRAHELDLFRIGELPPGTELKGQRVTVQIDGGRTRIRGPLRDAERSPEATNDDGLPIDDAPGRSRTRPERTFDGEWREPKLAMIFVHNEYGKMDSKCAATIEGTFQGPDAMAEMVAMHLHRLGAAQAVSVSFVADGANWIWDRVPTIVARAKLEKVTIHQVLDCCHAAHHISLALAAMGLRDKERLPLYRKMRTQLRNGQWQQVVDDLQCYMDENEDCEQMRVEIAYLRKHGEAGRLKYPTFRKLGVPLGSGAIESGIRRVINQRMKGSGLFWREGNAEAMLQVRAQVLARRWDARLAAMRNHEKRYGRRPWDHAYPKMSAKSECATTEPK
jgi:hypothetical protein